MNTLMPDTSFLKGKGRGKNKTKHSPVHTLNLSWGTGATWPGAWRQSTRKHRAREASYNNEVQQEQQIPGAIAFLAFLACVMYQARTLESVESLGS